MGKIFFSPSWLKRRLLSPVTENNVCLDVEGNKTDNVFMDLSAG